MIIKYLKNDTYREKCVLLNSVFEFIEILTWLLLTLFLCLRNQLISIYRKILTKAQPNKGPPEYRSIMVLMQNLSRFQDHPVLGPLAYNQDVLLKDHRVEEKQSFKRLSVYISITYRKLQFINKNAQSLKFFLCRQLF